MNKRMTSIDVLRGMTIFFMIIVNTPGSWSHVYPPLLHAEWHGCTPTDLVFPFFLFIVGVSMAFSFAKLDTQPRQKLLQKVLRRSALIFLIGLLLNWFPFYHKAFENLRIFGVLQRIGLSFGGAALLIIFIKNRKSLSISSVTILILYWLLLLFGANPPYELETNLCTQVDLFLFGENHLYKGFGIPFDPEGLLSTLPGIAHVLLGHQIGLVLKEGSSNKISMLKKLSSIGLFLIVLGQVWNIFLPINKPIWTSSYVLYTCGLATLLLTILIYILDIKEWRGWDYPFRVFGLNPLASYILSVLLIKVSIYFLKSDQGDLYSRIYSGFFKQLISPEFGSFAQAISFTGLVWIFAYLLYRKGKIIKI
jgi:predicted acyltransferase